jgi:hypothetical protein
VHAKRALAELRQGFAHIETDEQIRRKVYDMMPEVEQRDDPDRAGACLIIDIKSIKSTVASQSTRIELHGS